jgi:hypothetical protein
MLKGAGSRENEATTEVHKLERLRTESRWKQWLICGYFQRDLCSPIGIPENEFRLAGKLIFTLENPNAGGAGGFWMILMGFHPPPAVPFGEVIIAYRAHHTSRAGFYIAKVMMKRVNRKLSFSKFQRSLRV